MKQLFGNCNSDDIIIICFHIKIRHQHTSKKPPNLQKYISFQTRSKNFKTFLKLQKIVSKLLTTLFSDYNITKSRYEKGWKIHVIIIYTQHP